MVKNSKRDKVLFSAAIAGLFLGLAAAFGGFWLNLSSGLYFGLEKEEQILISDADDILAAGETIYNDVCILEEDIYILDSSFRIGSEERPFQGVFDGQGRTVYLEFETAAEGDSLFGSIGASGVVRNTNFVFGSVAVSGSAFAGIAQINYGTFENCTVRFAEYIISDETGIYSPAIGINRGTISNVYIGCSFSAAQPMESEAGIRFGSVCVYNYGRVEDTLSCPVFNEFSCTDEFSILTGAEKNAGIAAAVSVTVSGGNTENSAALLSDGVYTSDKTELSVCSHERSEIFSEDTIFDQLDFDNRVWRLDSAEGLVLIRA